MASYDLFFAIKWLGAAYLVWLGSTRSSARTVPCSSASDADPRGDALRMFRKGLILQMSNPKALVFFSPWCRSS
jgi:homoserine/homoserine lactone efflux protein